MYEIFGLAGKIQWMDLHMDKEGRSKGVCVLQYSHPIEAVQAISMFNGQRLYDRALAVKMDRFEKVIIFLYIRFKGSLPYFVSETGYGSSYNVSRVILIKNLPSDYTWQIVRDRVQQFGEIEAVDMLNPGVARIRFVLLQSLLQDAERTRTALAGTSVEGRPISVEFV
uniref:RRM domain-containing protein n=1 Tax=Heterorhabditis bacteriophora TaxID=37862 RepID=A0A1I7WVN9_HETBA